MGIITIRIAFSCTCQPNMKDVRPQRVMARMKASLRTFLKSLMNITQENIKSIIVAFWNTVIPFSITVHIDRFVLKFSHLFDARRQSFTKHGSIIHPVSIKVVIGEILGSTS